MTKKQLDVIQAKIGYKFKQTYLLEQAFVRKSYATENFYEDNEKLEFVGDKVLDFIIVKKMTDHYSYKESVSVKKKCIEKRTYVEYKDFLFFSHTEGEMTEIKKNIVRSETLASAIEVLELEKYLLMSAGDIKNQVQKETSVKEDLFEAIIGAIAIDSGWNFELIEEVIDKILSPGHYIINGFDGDVDYMAEFYKWWHSKYAFEPKFFYQDKGDEAFSCSLDLKGFNGLFIEGVGKSEDEARNNFSKRMYEFIKRQKAFEAEIKETIGKINYEKSVNQLQILYQKKLIEEPIYAFEEDAIRENGNPEWFCSCILKKAEKEATVSGETKAIAKKRAAFLVLCQLIGKDFF